MNRNTTLLGGAAAGAGLIFLGRVLNERRGRAEHDRSWPTVWRIVGGAAGGALTLYGVRTRSLLGRAATAAGAGLLTRSIADRDLRRLVRLAA